MKRQRNSGNIPSFLNTFLVRTLFAEAEETAVYDCHYDEIIEKAKTEKLEPVVLIDKANTGRAYLCAVGASYEKDEIMGQEKTPPVFYFALLDDSRKREFMTSLADARKEVVERSKLLKEQKKQQRAIAEVTKVSNE